MNGRRLTKVTLFSAACLAYAVILIWIQLWISLLTHWPPEHVYAEALSPDGSRVAFFSVKYQGIHPWIPTEIEPYKYVTIVDSKTGGILLRETGHYGHIKNSFTELAKKHAPWAVEEISSRPRSTYE
jgi:hypothetical protein